MEQISIFDYLETQKEPEDPVREPCERPCDVECFSLTCYLRRGYVRYQGKWVRDDAGNIMISKSKECDWVPHSPVPEGWERIPDTAKVVAITEPTDYTEGISIDKVAKGRVNKIPCLIGYLIGVSGFDGCFETLVPKYFKRTTIAPCPLTEYCTNMPAGCEGKTWWCGRTKQDFKEE